ncbi:hypothetical protein [Sphingomonas prati]|uniref:Uncharacterized protein n=1 Tax=Sphingomonas prati TaxID=1843237 RepID=A0A7W9BVN9_9SPHN|nr:hypothetical protein [Sphingomonas prati]MBB5731001.1 hypothetical protein [Sphingomonas prati]GGE98464.1 hypothetical protein GCM10011404_34540 [Sphingomonas prati]
MIEAVERAARAVPGPSIYASGTTDARLGRGAIVRDANNLPSGAVVSSGSRLAIIMVGSHKVQVPINALTGSATTLATTMTPESLDKLLAASAKYQEETAKLIRK